jgi:uncharacterized protein
MITSIERLSQLVIGSVETVSPAEIRVLLEPDAPHATALNTGTPAPFPRLNGYVLIPNEVGATVGYIAWIGIEPSPYPKRAGFRDFGLIDLPFPLRKMTVSPVGTLTTRRDQVTGATEYELSRGVMAFPSVGDQVLIPTSDQIDAIVGAKECDKRVRIGASPMAAHAAIMVDPDKIFGRHLAILGNTGSGKSCTVAGLIRWSINAALTDLKKAQKQQAPNMRFIVLDPNGEYSTAFADLGKKLRVFRVPPVTPSERPLDVPAWLWNGHEWTAVAHAQPGAQRPLLMQGLRELKSGHMESVPREAIIRRHLVSYATRVSSLLNSGTLAFGGSTRARFECARLLGVIAGDAAVFAESVEDPPKTGLVHIAEHINAVIDSRRSGNYFNDFSVADLESVRERLNSLASTLIDVGNVGPTSEDAPLFF